MHELLDALAKDFLAHLTSVGVGSGVLFFAIIHNMPEHPPANMQEYWTWVRDSLQSAIPVRQPRVVNFAPSLALPAPPPPAAPKENHDTSSSTQSASSLS